MRVLLVEDDDLLGSGLRAGLRQQGFQVDWVRDGVAAEAELLTGSHVAAVLDLGLPRQDDMVVLKAVRSRRLLSDEHLARLGERFFRLVGTQQSGSGLGWSIVTRVAALYGLNVRLGCSESLRGLHVDVEWS